MFDYCANLRICFAAGYWFQPVGLFVWRFSYFRLVLLGDVIRYLIGFYLVYSLCTWVVPFCFFITLQGF